MLEDGDRHKEGRILQIHPSTRRFRTLFNGGSGLGREEKRDESLYLVSLALLL